MLQDENMHDRVFLSFLWGVTGLSYISALLDSITSLKTIGDVLQITEEKAKQVEISVYIQSTEMKYMMIIMMMIRVK